LGPGDGGELRGEEDGFWAASPAASVSSIIRDPPGESLPLPESQRLWLFPQPKMRVGPNSCAEPKSKPGIKPAVPCGMRCKKQSKDFILLSAILEHNRSAERFQLFPLPMIGYLNGGVFINFRNCPLRPVLVARVSQCRISEMLMSSGLTRVLPDSSLT